jgi:Cof subfamily protein (haloacid dehalogenase superfamily)
MTRQPSNTPKIRLLALDADGTLVDPNGSIQPQVQQAVARAREAGVHVVICTGRRYRTTRPLIDELGLTGPVILHNGVLVKDAQSGQTTADRFLPEELFAPAMEMLRGVSPPLVYVDRYFDDVDLFAEPFERCHDFQEEYLAANPDVVKVVDSVSHAPSDAVVMLSVMADGPQLLRLQRHVEDEFGASVQTNYIMNKNYRGHILEVTRGGTSKWTTLRQQAEGLGIAPDEIAAIGDDTNDTEMIAEAGVGIAMGNAVDEVKAAANWQTESNQDAGVALAIDRLLESNGS